MADAVLADQQMELRDLVIGPGTSYCWVDEVPNWWGWTNVRTVDTPRQSISGVQGGRDLLDKESIIGQVLVSASTADELRLLIDEFLVNFYVSDDDIPLRANLLGQTRRRYGRPRRAKPGPRLTTRFARVNKFGSIISFQFDALDPVVFGDTLNSLLIGLPSGGGGFSPPFVPPFLVAGGGSSGVGSVVNSGLVPTRWIGRIDGPIVNPAITHQGSGYTLSFSVNGGLTLGPGDFLLIDSWDRSALLNGEGDRRNTLDLGSQWFQLDPGANAIGFAAASGSGIFTIEWRDAYP